MERLKQALNGLSQLAYAGSTPNKRQTQHVDTLQAQVKGLQQQLAVSVPVTGKASAIGGGAALLGELLWDIDVNVSLEYQFSVGVEGGCSFRTNGWIHHLGSSALGIIGCDMYIKNTMISLYVFLMFLCF